MRRGLWWGLALALAGCVVGGGGGGGGDECDAGDVLLCACPDGSEGRRACDDGEFGVCVCGGGAGGEGGGGGDPVMRDGGVGDADPDGGGGEGGGGPALEYRYVIVADDAGDESFSGTAGCDICSIVANCGAEDLLGSAATLTQGFGTVCDGTSMEAPCESGVDRQNASAALVDEGICDPGSSPSDYVSLGLDGVLAVEFVVDLTGCDVLVTELEGPQNEPYSVYVCATDALDVETCLRGGEPVGRSPSHGGSISISVPLAE